MILYAGPPLVFYHDRNGMPEAGRKRFHACHAFIKKSLPTRRTPRVESLVNQVPAGR